MFLSKKKNNNRKEGNSGGFLQNPKILEVNLVKDEVSVSFDWQQSLLVLALVLGLATLFVAEIYFGLVWWEKQEIAQTQAIEDEIAQTNVKVDNLKNDIGSVLAYKEKSAAFSDLLDDHIYWTNFFSWLEKNTLSSVKYQDFSGGLDGEYSLKAVTNTYADVSWQTKAFLKSPLTDKISVSMANAVGKEEGEADGAKAIKEISFALSLKVKPEIFKK